MTEGAGAAATTSWTHVLAGRGGRGAGVPEGKARVSVMLIRIAIISTRFNATLTIIYYYIRGLRVLVAAKTLQNTEIQGEHLVWTGGNGDTMHEVYIPHSIPRT